MSFKLKTLIAMAASDKRILSYHDEILFKSDLQILRNPNFLINDRIISFFFTHLSLSLSSPSRTLLIPPSISYLISVSPDPEILALLDLPSKSLILFPVNDNPDPSVPEGGSHWSLLVFDRKRNEFVHHDSLSPLNASCARGLYEKVRKFVGGDGEKARFLEKKTPRQRNGYDCGVFVMAIAKVICEWGDKGDDDGYDEERWFRVLEEDVNAERVERLRWDILRLVLSLMDKK